MDALLYQFPVSHYCEKARWALDYKNVPYRIKNLLPGLHVKVLSSKVNDTTLPVLYLDGNYIQGSDQIIDFLDQTISGKPLSPADPGLHSEALEWENFASTELALPFSVFYYSHMLENPALLKKRSIQNGPWYAPLYFAIIFNMMCQRIIELYKINQDSAKQSRMRIEAGLQKLEQRLQSQSYIVDDQFTRADLSIAALLSPLAKPDHAVPNIDTLPVAIRDFREQIADAPAIQWVRQIYLAHRN